MDPFVELSWTRRRHRIGDVRFYAFLTPFSLELSEVMGTAHASRRPRLTRTTTISERPTDTSTGMTERVAERFPRARALPTTVRLPYTRVSERVSSVAVVVRVVRRLGLKLRIYPIAVARTVRVVGTGNRPGVRPRRIPRSRRGGGEGAPSIRNPIIVSPRIGQYNDHTVRSTGSRNFRYHDPARVHARVVGFQSGEKRSPHPPTETSCKTFVFVYNTSELKFTRRTEYYVLYYAFDA